MYFQLLVAASLLVAGYQDVRERLVSDLVWVPAVAGAVLVVYFDPSPLLFIKLALVGGIGLAFAKYGALGEADAIAMVIVTADGNPIAPIPVMVATGVVVMAHIAYLYLAGYAGREKTISLAQFRAEARWIPKAVIVQGERRDVEKNVNFSRESVEGMADEGAMVEVQYGVPDVAYIALGYVAYIVYLVVFQPAAFAGFP